MSKKGSILNLSNDAKTVLATFYENTPGLSFEEINLSLIRFLQPIKHSNYIIPNDQINNSLTAIKNEIINDFERIIHNPDTSVPSLLEKTHNSLIEKTAIIFNSSMPKYNNQIISTITDHINDFRKTTQDEYNKLQGSIDNNHIKEFAQNFDLKLSMLMQNLQQPLYSSLNSMEDKINHKISSSTSDIIRNQEKLQEKMMCNISDITNTDTVSRSISTTSKPIKVILTPLFPSSEIKNCNFNINMYKLTRIHKQTVMLKTFDSFENISLDELTDFVSLIDEHQCNGILISNNSGISTKKNYEIEIHNNKIIVFLHNVEYNGNLIASAVDIIDSLTNRLSQYIKTNDATLTIPKEIMDSINNEYHTFSAQKTALVELLKEHQKRVISQIDELRFPALDKYLSSKYLIPISKPGLKCDLCKLYTANNLKALAAHKRGCARKLKA